MRVNFRGKEIMVRWTYDAMKTPAKDAKGDPIVINGKSIMDTVYLGSTSCLAQIAPEEVISATVTVCKTKKCRDRFTKNGGRKASLKALVSLLTDTLHLNKDERREFWTSYAHMRGGRYI